MVVHGAWADGSSWSAVIESLQARGYTTTFASVYTRESSLAGALDPEMIRRCHRAATGEKYLLKPHSD